MEKLSEDYEKRQDEIKREIDSRIKEFEEKYESFFKKTSKKSDDINSSSSSSRKDSSSQKKSKKESDLEEEEAEEDSKKDDQQSKKQQSKHSTNEPKTVKIPLGRYAMYIAAGFIANSLFLSFFDSAEEIEYKVVSAICLWTVT